MQSPRPWAETPGWWHGDVKTEGLLLTRRGHTDGEGDTQDGHWSSWWCLLWCLWSLLLMEIPGTNCLRWGDLNNKQINVLHGPWVWPGSQQPCPVAKPRSDWDTSCGPESRHEDHKRTRNSEETGDQDRKRGERRQTIAGQNLLWIADLRLF